MLERNVQYNYQKNNKLQIMAQEWQLDALTG